MTPRGRLHIGIILLALANMLPAVEVENSWWQLSLAVTAAGLSLILIRPDGSSKLPAFYMHIGLLLTGAFLVWEMFGAHEEPTVYIIDLSHFIIFLGCFKFFELRTHRDYALLATISFLLLVISAFASGSPIFGAVLLIDLTFGLAWLMAFQCERALLMLDQQSGHRVRQSGLEAGEALSTQRLPRRSFALPAIIWAIGLFLFAGVVFLAVPRGWGRGLFVRIQNVIPTSVTGFSGELTLTNNTLVEDVTPVLRARFTRGGRVLKEGEVAPLLRGKTFERYEKGRWLQRGRFRLSLDVDPKQGPSILTRISPDELGDDVIEQEVWLDDVSSGCLFSLYPPLDFDSDDIKRLRFRPNDLTIQAPDRNHTSVHYKVRTTDRLSRDEKVILDPPPERPRRPTRMSEVHRDVREFAEDFFRRRGDPSDPLERRKLAAALCEYLGSGEFEYTLNRGVRTRTGDSIRDFLFFHKRGHCEYFASAMTVVCQAGGIPARVVTGYAGGEYDDADGSFTFRRSDAHAWVEVFMADEGWVPFDPSPISTASRNTASGGLWATVNAWLRTIELKWSTTVVAFDAQTWATLVQRVVDFGEKLQQEDAGSGISGITIKTVLWGPDLLPLWQRFFYWLLLALVLVLLVLVIRALGILSLMLKESIGVGRQSRSVIVRRHDARFYDRLLLLLASKGHVKPGSRSPLEFARDLASAHRELKDLPLITNWFYEVQYGRSALTQQQQMRIRALLARLREDTAFGARNEQDRIVAGGTL